MLHRIKEVRRMENKEMQAAPEKRCYQKDHPYVVFVLSGFDAGRIILYFI